MDPSPKALSIRVSTSRPCARLNRLVFTVLHFVFTVLAVLSLQTAALAQQPWPLWESYTQHNLDQQGRVIDHSSQDRTTSEGQAYGMFFALVTNDRTRFDKILNWT